jgi:hypothetical protein
MQSKNMILVNIVAVARDVPFEKTTNDINPSDPRWNSPCNPVLTYECDV